MFKELSEVVSLVWRDFTLFAAEKATRWFDLPEFVIIKLDCKGRVWYLYSVNSLWTSCKDDALLFYDIEEIKQKVPFYNREEYLAISHFDVKYDFLIQQEMGYWDKWFAELRKEVEKTQMQTASADNTLYTR